MNLARAGRTEFRNLCSLFLFTGLCLGLGGCGTGQRPPLSHPTFDQYRHLLAISNVQSFYYTEPGSSLKVPQVRGTLRNLGTKRLVAVEFTLAFKDALGKTIYEEKVYPVYVSSATLPALGKPLNPGQEIKFAFRSPSCPRSWEPGQVEVYLTKVVPQS